MRRLWWGVVAVLIVLGQAACGDNGGSGKDGPPHVAFVLANSQLSFATAMADGFRTGVGRVGGVTVEVTGPDIVDGQKQLQMLQEAVKTAQDGVSVFTLTPEILAQALAESVRQGIPVIAVDNPPLSTSGIKLFVGNDNYELGRALAREVIAKLPAGAAGKVVLGTNAPGVKVLDRRAKGMRDEFKQALPAVKVLGPFDTKQEIPANLAAWRTLTTVNKDALAFLGTGDADGWNLAAIRRERRAAWVAGAFDLDPRSLTAVRAGELVLVSPEHFIKGEVAGRLQARHAKDGEPPPEGWFYIPGLPVNSANVDAVIARQASVEATAKAVSAQVDTILGDPSYLRKMSAVG
jgi:ribose transport system substrate-binding protein